MKKVAFATLGCRFNQHETSEMSEELKDNNFEIVPFDSEADLYIINTCTVTNKSDSKCVQMIKKATQKGENPKIIVTGCLPETNPEKIKSIPGVHLILGNTEKLDLVKYINSSNLFNKQDDRTKNSPVIAIRTPNKGVLKNRIITSFNNRTIAYLKVQTGCNLKCSFCIVTIARGKSISDSIDNVLKQAKELIKSGFQEIVLTGINLGCYGHDFSTKTELADLLIELLKLEWTGRIRLSSINPTEITEKLIHTINENDRICNYLHIPLQSGDDEILEQMRRNYSSKEYQDLIYNISTRIKNIGIGTDILTGFPGETDKQFNNTYNILKNLPITFYHVFSYSKRENTDAATYSNQVDKKTRSSRSKKIILLGDEKKKEFMNKSLGTFATVLFKNIKEKNTGFLTGNTASYFPVLVDGPDSYKNKLVQVYLENIEGEYLIGKLNQKSG